MTILVVQTHYSLKVYFGDVLHLCFPRGEVIGVQSWRDGPTHFSIEYSLRSGGTVRTEYDTPEKWKAILSGLDGALQ